MLNNEPRSWFTLVGDMNRRDTRGANCPLNIIPNKTRLCEKKLSSTRVVVPDWNNRPREVKEGQSLLSFKHIKHFLLESGALTDTEG